MNKRKQRGVALLFALGMLTILLISGMAFVANALTSHKVAVNNSARSQARIFARSALSRVLASMMLYQYQLQKETGDPPENFDVVQSDDKESTASNDGLEQNSSDSKESLLKLPADNSIISLGIAEQFNTKLADNTVKWVYFYDSIDRDKIIGRAAWKTISTSPQISAPVFMSGKLDVDGDSPNWKPSDHRWGREIDEVSLDGNFFKYVVTGPFTMQNYDAIYAHLNLGNSDDAKKRFIDRWFMPDAASDNFSTKPTAFVPEVYFCKNGKEQYPLMRFNISELYQPDYGFSGTPAPDQWYVRFGIDSNKPEHAAIMNSADVLEKLTRNSQQQLMNDKYDYDLKADDRSGLPFLRRIGNDKGTFEDISALRKQIAANFNDYCDADSVPTSDKLAENWVKDTGYEEPSFTGNEKTPYIYELGFRFGLFPESSGGKADFTTTALSIGQENFTPVDGKYSAEINPVYAGITPIVKLANVYNFDPSGFSDFAAKVNLGKFEVKFRPEKVTFEVQYTTQEGTEDVQSHTETKTLDVTAGMEFAEITGTVAEDKFKTSTLTTPADNSKLDNRTGVNPYPLLVPGKLNVETETGNDVMLTFDDDNTKKAITFKLPEETIRTEFGVAAGAVLNVQKVTLKSIDSITVTSLKLNVKRIALAATVNGKVTGLDYVKEFKKDGAAHELTWPQGSESVTIAVKEESKIPGLYIGGIRNYDPRQNLNYGDWYLKLRIAASNNIAAPGSDDNLATVMCVKKLGTDHIGKMNDADETAENNKFKPDFADSSKDKELAAEPAWRDNEHGTDNSLRLSTAFIRNAPMMSPWEIGLIHRGVKWQTINLKNACDPENNSNNISLEGHKPFDGWNAAGTGYSGGDAAILDQIKMTDECFTFGKINVNRLRKDDPLFNKEGADLNLEQYIAKALFENVRYNENMIKFYAESTRDNVGALPNAASSTGIPINNFDSSTLFSDNRPELESRAAFIGYYSGGTNSLSDAFGKVTTLAQTDAAQEEIVGKTINLLGAEAASPSQIKVVVVAQVIKDVAGTQYRNDVSKDCEFGVFEPGYDDITGEVKMLVTIDRDVSTYRMMVRRIDYLE